MQSLRCFYVLITCSFLTEATAAYSNARRERRRLSPSVGGVVSASQGELRGIAAAGASASAKQEHVELLRFVTAYRTGIEAMVDMTPYTPLLQASVAADNLTMYTFIDTWVNNHTEKDILYMNNVTNKCHLKKMSQGNGWSLSASLVFWPRHKDHVAVSTHPRESVTLASGYYGGDYPIGRVGFHNGNVSENGKVVLLDKALDFSSVKVAAVYDMSEHEIGLASLMGHVAQRAEVFTRIGNKEALESLMQDAFESLLWQGLALVHVSSVDEETHIVQGKYNGSQLHWQPHMPVYFSSADIFTDTEVGHGWWLNSSMPLKPVGWITHADGENVSMQLAHHCYPTNITKFLPHLLVPWSPHVADKIKQVLLKAKKVGVEAAARGQIAASVEPLLLVEGHLDARRRPLREHIGLLEPKSSALISPTLLGQLDLIAAGSGGSEENTWHRLLLRHPINRKFNVSDGRKVLVLTQERHGRLLERKFELPTLVFGDRVILQLAVTGHGWSATAEQCGEYCHAVYRLNLNGQVAANVTQFRDDCKNNPINGSVQFGTWDESRNGWCPGTVVPGLFIDLTDHMKKGPNSLTIDLLVWSNTTLRYEAYTDYAGFVFNDLASLAVGITAFVYNESAVQAIHGQDRAYTAAEAAVRDGCSVPHRLKPPAFVREASEDQVLLQIGSRAASSGQVKNSRRHPAEFILPQHDVHNTLQEPTSFMRRHFHHSVVPVDAQDVEAASSMLEGKARRMARAEIGARGANIDVYPHQAHAAARVHSFPKGRFDFEGRAPWYLYNETTEGHIDVKHVPLFTNRLMQGNSRDVQVHIDRASVPSDWSQVALHFHLHKPDDLEYDHWDRVGSMGLRFR